ncbi:MAG: PAS domain S-box protein [Bacteroidota bacterium]
MQNRSINMVTGKDQKAEEQIIQISMELATLIGREYFEAITCYLSQLLKADVVLVGEITDDRKHARTVAVFNDGEVVDDFEFSLADSPFAPLLEGSLRIFREDLQKLFPEDYLLADLSLDAFAGIPLFDNNGKPIGFLVALYRQPIENISLADHALHFCASRVSAELDRKLAFDKLKEYESFLFGIVDMLEDVLFIADLQGKIRLLSPSAIRVFGWSPEEMIGQSIANFLTEDTRQLGIQEFEKCISSGLPRLRLKLKVNDKSGKARPVVWSANLTKSEGEINGCIGIFHEISNKP